MIVSHRLLCRKILKITWRYRYSVDNAIRPIYSAYCLLGLWDLYYKTTSIVQCSVGAIYNTPSVDTKIRRWHMGQST